jgi:hypothetical protein
MVGAATIARSMGKGKDAAETLQASRERIKRRLGI